MVVLCNRKELPSWTSAEDDPYTNRNLNEGGSVALAVQVKVTDNPMIGTQLKGAEYSLC